MYVCMYVCMYVPTAVPMVFFVRLTTCRFRNVTFEITSTGVGVFQVSARFMGVAMEKVELVFQVRNTACGRVSSVLTEAEASQLAVA